MDLFIDIDIYRSKASLPNKCLNFDGLVCMGIRNITSSLSTYLRLTKPLEKLNFNLQKQKYALIRNNNFGVTIHVESTTQILPWWYEHVCIMPSHTIANRPFWGSTWWLYIIVVYLWVRSSWTCFVSFHILVLFCKSSALISIQRSDELTWTL